MDGYIGDGCFKLIWYPDWFKFRSKTQGQSLENRQKKGQIWGSSGKLAVAIETQRETPLDFSEENNRMEEFNTMLSTLQSEFSRLVKGKGPANIGSTQRQNSHNISNFTCNSHSISILFAITYDVRL